MRNKFIGAYAVIGLLFALYGTWWGDYAFKGFMYNVGRAIVWPAQIFPQIGALMTIIIVVGVVILLSLRKP
jgi:hypothetical protein